nr:receptor-like protein 32 [Ziziphus jujuba var. spinosa]
MLLQTFLLYPKVESWAIQEENTSDCCSWDGVKCDQQSGNVIELDLSSSCLYGSVNSSSTLLRLSHPRSLNLAYNHFNYSPIPYAMGNLSSAYFLANFSSLTVISLNGCGMYGEFPKAIFQLPNLQVLSLRDNQDLTGYFPEFHIGSPLKQILLWNTSFSGEIPSSIKRLGSLNMLDLGGCNFSGLIPSSMGKLTRLTYLDLSENKFIGQIPYLLQNLTQLTLLILAQNYFHGVMPSSFARLVNLEVLILHDNELSGAVNFDIFLNMKYLKILDLTANIFSVSITETNSTNATVPQFNFLGLGYCNLKKFPGFLRYQDNLCLLELVGNRIHGPIPNWLWNISLESIEVLDLGLNFLTGFGNRPGPVVLPWRRLNILYLFNDMLKGQLLIPPPSIITYGGCTQRTNRRNSTPVLQFKFSPIS